MEEKKLPNCKEEKSYVVQHVKGGARFLDRVGAMGITPNTKIQVMQNKRKQPILIYARNTLITINRNEGSGILVKEVQ